MGNLLQRITLAEIDDLLYTIRRYYSAYKRLPNFFFPQTFSDHLFRKKILDRNPILTQMADKHDVRAYVAERIGPQHLTELYCITNDPTQIDFDQLPNRFVIKATHGCNYNLLVQDKSTLQYSKVIQLCQKWLAINYYKTGREWCYKGISPRIMIEEYLQPQTPSTPFEYKFFCFGGVPLFIQFDIPSPDEHKRNMYDPEWNLLPFRYGFNNATDAIEPPNMLDTMNALAQKLAHGLDFVRVDFYGMEERIVAGEMTHYPGNGFRHFSPVEYDYVVGQMWNEQTKKQATAQAK